MNIASRFTGAAHAIRNSSILVASQFVTILVRLVYLYILVRYLAPAGYGVLTYGMYWYLVLLPFTYVGADVVLGREIGRDRQTAPSLLSATLSLRFLACTIATLVSIVIAVVLEQDPSVRSVIVIFSFSLVGRSVWMWSAAVFTAFEDVRPILKIDVACRTLEIAALIILLETSAPGLRTIASVHAASWLVEGLVAVALIARRWTLGNRWSFGQWLPVLRQGLPAATFAIAMALYFQLPLVLFRQTQGAGDSLGYFALAFQIITYLAGIPYLAANASLPVLSRSAARGDGKDRIAALLMIAAIVAGGFVLVIAASFLVAPTVSWLFGDRYAQTTAILEGGLWLLIPASLALLFQHLLFSNGIRSVLATAAPVIGVVVMVFLFPALARTDGYSGALWSVAAGLLVWALLAGLETVRIGFFGRRGGDIQSPNLGVADVW